MILSLDAVTDEFDGYLVGCLFHWKQCLRRYLLSLGIDLVADIEAIQLRHKEPLRRDMSDRHKDALKSLFKIPPEFYLFVMPPKPVYVL